jgi:hypothetical protein
MWPANLLAWNRSQKPQKWTFENRPAKPGSPREGDATRTLVAGLAEEIHSRGQKGFSGIDLD